MIGGKGPKTLPYALKDYFNTSAGEVRVIASQTLVEIQNSGDETITLRRAIKSEEKSDKLIEVIPGSLLTGEASLANIIPTFIHDGGSAKEKGVGYFKYLEDFMGLSLPLVPSTGSGLVKLYIQTIMAALIVEQKRGWTDYIANIPYFQIRNARNKVVEYLLGLDTFENNRLKAELRDEVSKIHSTWAEKRSNLAFLARTKGVTVQGIPESAHIDFDIASISAVASLNGMEISLPEYIEHLILKYESYTNAGPKTGESGDDIDEKYDQVVTEVSRLSIARENLLVDLHIKEEQKREYEKFRKELGEDLRKNMIANKLRKLGASLELSISSDTCPTCHQGVEDSLILADTNIHPMNIDENIDYIKSQLKMLVQHISGATEGIGKAENQLRQLTDEINLSRKILASIRRDSRSSNEVSEADVRSKLLLEEKIEALNGILDEVENTKSEFEELVGLLIENRKKYGALPSEYYSPSDLKCISAFERMFPT